MKNDYNELTRPVRQSNQRVSVLALLILLSLPLPMAWAQQPKNDLTTASLEDLLNIEVTSVSKKEEKLFDTAAAIYVITQEEIRRSGLTNLPELLRLVPGLSVARIDGNKWAISARGFNGRFANKLLVLLDGRTIYSPETSGVYWEVHDVPLETIERVEVIRGPGGTLWGANAVNGVINIITKHTKDTQGGLLTLGGGSEERGFGSARYGGSLGEHADYRVYARYFNRGSLVNALGRAVNDGQQSLRGGGRVDWQLTQRDALTLQGDVYRTNLHEASTNLSLDTPFAPVANTPGEFTGGNLLGRWTRRLSTQSDLALQVYYDRFARDNYDLGVTVNTVDLDFQHRFAPGHRQEIIWGGGYRHVWDRSNGTNRTPAQFVPADETSRLASIFAQDEITLVKDRLRLILGSKLQYFSRKHDISSDLKLQPNVRVSWVPGRNQSVWGAVSQAVKTSARTEENLRANYAAFPGPDGTLNVLTLFGNDEVKFETVRAHELGYRVQPGPQVSFDVAAFYNRYNHLHTYEPGQPFFEAEPRPRIVIPIYYDNLMRGETYGAEVSAHWNVVRQWKLTGSYALLRMQLHRDATSRNVEAEKIEGHSPRHQFQLHSWLKLPRNFELDSALYTVSSLTTLQVPSYTRLDVRLGWRVQENIELSLGLQNLLDNRHPEFNGADQAVVASQVKRSLYGKLIWHF